MSLPQPLPLDHRFACGSGFRIVSPTSVVRYVGSRSWLGNLNLGGWKDKPTAEVGRKWTKGGQTSKEARFSRG